MRVLRARYRAYCSSANLGTGFDIMAVALDAYYDEVDVSIRSPGDGSVDVSFTGPYGSGIEPLGSTAYEAASTIISEYGLRVDVSIRVWKGIPVGKGLGSSGATAAAVVRALNHMLGLNLSLEDEVSIAGRAEKVSAGTPHYDNVAASLAGGLITMYIGGSSLKIMRIDAKPIFIISIPDVPVPKRKTEVMRSILPKHISLKDHVIVCSRLAALIYGLMKSDYEAIGIGMHDPLIVPRRARYSPYYNEAERVALEAGARGFTLSGAGPSTIALVESMDRAVRVAEALKKFYTSRGVRADIRICRVAPGAHRVS